MQLAVVVDVPNSDLEIVCRVHPHEGDGLRLVEVFPETGGTFFLEAVGGVLVGAEFRQPDLGGG